MVMATGGDDAKDGSSNGDGDGDGDNDGDGDGVSW